MVLFIMRVFFRIIVALLAVMVIAGLIITYIYEPDIRLLEKYYGSIEPETRNQEFGDTDGEEADTKEPSPGDIKNEDSKGSEDADKSADETYGLRTEESFLSVDEINFFQKISISDKLKVLSVISRLKKEDIEAICRMTSGGVTIAEMNEIREILEERLGKKDVDMLENLINKNKELYSVWKENDD